MPGRGGVESELMAYPDAGQCRKMQEAKIAYFQQTLGVGVRRSPEVTSLLTGAHRQHNAVIAHQSRTPVDQGQRQAGFAAAGRPLDQDAASGDGGRSRLAGCGYLKCARE